MILIGPGYLIKITVQYFLCSIATVKKICKTLRAEKLWKPLGWTEQQKEAHLSTDYN